MNIASIMMLIKCDYYFKINPSSDTNTDSHKFIRKLMQRDVIEQLTDTELKRIRKIYNKYLKEHC